MAAHVTSEGGKFVATGLGTLFAFVVVTHVLGAVLYLSFVDLLSSRFSFAIEPPSAIRLHLSLAVFSIPTAALVFVFERREGRLLLRPVFRALPAAFGILFLVFALLNILIPEPLLHPI